MRRGASLVLVLLLAGCGAKAPSGNPTTSTEPPPEIDPLIIDHDHRDPSLHVDSTGFEFRAFYDAKDALGTERARLSDLQFFGNRSIVTINGRGGTTAGGFGVFDLGPGGNLTLLGRYRSGSEDNWYTKFSPDGKIVYLTANGGTSPMPLANGTLESARSTTATGGARGIHIVNVENPRNPVLKGFFPAPGRVINLASWEGPDHAFYLAASMAADRVGAQTPVAQTHELNYVSILKLAGDERTSRLDEVARWRPTDITGTVNAFPHDLSVNMNPFNGRLLLFVAYWDAGAYVVDVTDPLRAALVSHIKAAGPQDHVHTFKPHDQLLDGKYYAVIAPETFANEPAGPFRMFDLTDARNPKAVAAWSPPPGPRNTESLLFSAHEFSLAEGFVFASNFHGGAWQLRVPDLVPVAHWAKSVGDPRRTDDWAVDVATVVYHGGDVFAVDMNGGVVALAPWRPASSSPLI